jgi:hypothetical protein
MKIPIAAKKEKKGKNRRNKIFHEKVLLFLEAK